MGAASFFCNGTGMLSGYVPIWTPMFMNSNDAFGFFSFEPNARCLSRTVVNAPFWKGRHWVCLRVCTCARTSSVKCNVARWRHRLRIDRCMYERASRPFPQAIGAEIYWSSMAFEGPRDQYRSCAATAHGGVTAVGQRGPVGGCGRCPGDSARASRATFRPRPSARSRGDQLRSRIPPGLELSARASDAVGRRRCAMAPAELTVALGHTSGGSLEVQRGMCVCVCCAAGRVLGMCGKITRVGLRLSSLVEQRRLIPFKSTCKSASRGQVDLHIG